VPVKRLDNGSRVLETKELNKLANRLKDEFFDHEDAQDKASPYIYELPIGNSGFYDVLVIWNQFAGLDYLQRQEIIRSAYQLLAETKKVPKIQSYEGYTVDEAIQNGAINYELHVNASISDETESASFRNRINSLKLKYGAHSDSTGRLYLGFPRRELAEEVLRQIEAESPNDTWQLFVRD
jgi:hypothetical protein